MSRPDEAVLGVGVESVTKNADVIENELAMEPQGRAAGEHWIGSGIACAVPLYRVLN